MILMVLLIYFNSIKVQLKPEDAILTNDTSVDFNSIKVQLKHTRKESKVLPKLISIP